MESKSKSDIDEYWGGDRVTANTLYMEQAIFEKAKMIIQTKTFCLMEWQVNDVKQMGREVMEKKDMEFLLALEMSKPKLLHLDMEKYDSAELFIAIEEAKNKKMDGVLVLWSPIINDDVTKILAMGYFVEFLGPGDIGDEIYFTHDSLIQNQIFDFKSLFGNVATMVKAGII